ncbi:DUF3127 domain-containing protein [Gaoshiqia sp. Z1-71]|uniref:DUF3127 domain-containing protein n=1 Tax=Gaoshiqia hydrogeniformans TaxID=3290090 RepID=UPI003BF8DF1F
MEIKGKIRQVLPVSSGTSKTGNEWKKQEFVIDTIDEQFPKQICFTLFNDKLSLVNGLKPGTDVNVSFSVESREFNGKWYHNINAWKVDNLSAEAPEHFIPDYTADDIPPEPTDEGNDLPF